MYRKLQTFNLRTCSPSVISDRSFVYSLKLKKFSCVLHLYVALSLNLKPNISFENALSLSPPPPFCLRTKPVQQNTENNCQARPNPEAFCEIRRLITMRTTASKWIIFLGKLNYSAPSYLRPISINLPFCVWVLQVVIFHQIFQPSLCIDF
jgi:hypothetical protein